MTDSIRRPNSPPQRRRISKSTNKTIDQPSHSYLAIIIRIFRYWFKRFKNQIITALIVTLIFFGYSHYFAKSTDVSEQTESGPADQSLTLSNDSSVSDAKPNEEDQDIIARVRALIVIPENETPALSTVTDVNAIDQNKEFFADAMNGDRILIFKEARKAYLYRPSTNKIINLAPINIDDVSPTTNDSTVDGKLEFVSVALYQAANSPGLLPIFEEKLIAEFENAIVTTKTKAAADRDQSVIVVNRAQGQTIASELSSIFGLPIVDLPENETEPITDLLIILGQDQVQSRDGEDGQDGNDKR